MPNWANGSSTSTAESRPWDSYFFPSPLHLIGPEQILGPVAQAQDVHHLAADFKEDAVGASLLVEGHRVTWPSPSACASSPTPPVLRLPAWSGPLRCPRGLHAGIRSSRPV